MVAQAQVVRAKQTELFYSRLSVGRIALLCTLHLCLRRIRPCTVLREKFGATHSLPHFVSACLFREDAQSLYLNTVPFLQEDAGG